MLCQQQPQGRILRRLLITKNSNCHLKAGVIDHFGQQKKRESDLGEQGSLYIHDLMNILPVAEYSDYIWMNE